MLRRKSLALAAACAAVGFGGFVRAADVSDSSNTTVTQAPVALDDAATPPSKPMMWLLEKAGVGKSLENWGINFAGYIEGAYTFDANHPMGNYFTGRAFDSEQESLLLDQVDLNISRSVDATKGKFDIGFTVEQIYGADAAYVHSNGLTTYSPTKILGSYTAGPERIPKNQYDLYQANLTFAIPVGKGLSVEIGKFSTLMGYEVTNPSGNSLYSHSFLFTQLPFTQTGLLATYNIYNNSSTDLLTVTGGVTRGWDQALKDVNGSLDVTGQINYAKDKWTLTLNGSSGDQRPDPAPGVAGLDGWRTVLDFTAKYQYSDNLVLALNTDYGIEPQAAPGGTSAQWYGAAAYASYTISKMFTLNLRGEWFDDTDGASPTSFNPGVPNQYYEATVGVAITPFPNNPIGSNLVIRPEVRCDYADKATWVGDNTHDQLTGAIEAYFTF